MPSIPYTEFYSDETATTVAHLVATTTDILRNADGEKLRFVDKLVKHTATNAPAEETAEIVIALLLFSAKLVAGLAQAGKTPDDFKFTHPDDPRYSGHNEQ